MIETAVFCLLSGALVGLCWRIVWLLAEIRDLLDHVHDDVRYGNNTVEQ